MTRSAISLYMIATCSLVVVAPGRFAIGLLLAFELIFLLGFSTLFRKVLKKLKLGLLFAPALVIFLVFMTMLFRQLLFIWMPEVALQLGFVIYLPAISPFSTVFIFDEKEFSFKDEIQNAFKPAVNAACYTVIFSLIRDIVGYGTISFPGKNKIHEIVLFKSTNINAFSFLATIPGAIVMSAFFLSVYLAIERKINIQKEAGLLKNEVDL